MASLSTAAPYHRQGYAVEAMACLLDHLFDPMKRHRIVAGTDGENSASMRLIGRLALKFEGHLMPRLWFKGRWADEYTDAMLRNEWLACCARISTI